ncbi:MAG: 6-phosphogluconolactonase [Chlamydiales bacterium]|nr:6-phosphogluconolactonase [Chlamydiales bacterium]
MEMKKHELDERRTLFLPGNHDATLKFAVEHWVNTANEAIAKRGRFTVALSGGSTPKKIFQELSTNFKKKVDWSRVYLFWSDERSVPPTDKDSNYHMAMEEGGLKNLLIPKDHIFRMAAENELEKHAALYQKKIQEHVPNASFDLVMLGMGDDGHTASLFPHTEGVHVKGQLVTPNHVPQKDTWRMSFTFDCINNAQNICLYVLGANKSEILAKVLTSPLDKEAYPSQGVGSKEHKACWIIDEEASKNLLVSLK